MKLGTGIGFGVALSYGSIASGAPPPPTGMEYVGGGFIEFVGGGTIEYVN
jgi:hypothetical protein